MKKKKKTAIDFLNLFSKKILTFEFLKIFKKNMINLSSLSKENIELFYREFERKYLEYIMFLEKENIFNNEEIKNVRKLKRMIINYVKTDDTYRIAKNIVKIFDNEYSNITLVTKSCNGEFSCDKATLIYIDSIGKKEDEKFRKLLKDLIEDDIKKKEEYLKKFDSKVFSLKLTDYNSTNEVQRVSLKYYMKFSTIFSATAIERAFNTGTTSEDKLFVEYNMISAPKWVGLKNYIDVFTYTFSSYCIS